MIEPHDKAVESELERGTLELICAWHVKYFGFRLVMREGAQPASHGICAGCRKILTR